MDNSAVLSIQPCQRILGKMNTLLEGKVGSSLESLLKLSSVGEEASLFELGEGKVILLLFIQGLALGDVAMVAPLSELARDYRPLESTHFVSWLVEDFKIDGEVVKKALDRAVWLNTSRVVCVPDSVMCILRGVVAEITTQ